MRNLKRALSLTLASVMLLGMMVVGSNAAAGYDDVKETDNVEAIEVLQAVEVMVGDDRGFGPDRPVSRAEMAVVMGKLLNLDYNYYVSTCPFTDVSGNYDWARGWVGACAANGIVSGRGEGIYDPAATVTAVEAASMIMRALGYFQYKEDYEPSFQLATVKQGSDIGLFEGVGTDGSTPMTRNQVARMALNALRSEVVTFTGTPGIEVNGVKVGYKAEYTPRTSTEAKYNAIEGRTSDVATEANHKGQYYVQLGEQLYDGKLKLNNDAIDVFGRPSRDWEYDGKAIGTYIKEELMVMDNVGEVTGNDLYTLLGAGTIKDYGMNVAVDGVDLEDNDAQNILTDAYFDETDMNRNNKKKVGETGTGTLTQVFVDHEDDQVYVAVINTYLARAARDYDEKAEEATLTVYGIDEYRTSDKYFKDLNKKADETMKVQDEDFTLVKDVKKNDSYLVTVAEGEIQTMVPAEVLEAVTLTAFKKGAHVVSDGTEYKYTTTATFKVGDLDAYTTTDNTNLKDITYDIYLDAYGNLIGIEEVEAVKNYVFITGIDLDGSNLYNKNATANALFLDGTSKTITINMAKSVWHAHTGLNNTDVVIEGDATLNTWCTYTVNSDGVYTVTEVYATSMNTDAKNRGDVNANVFVNANNYPDPDKKLNSTTYPNKTKLAQSWQPTTNTGKVEVKNLRLSGGGTGVFANVYGDSTSVYLTAELDELADRGNPNGSWGIIKGVDSVSTGIADTSINIWEKADVLSHVDKTKINQTVHPTQIAQGVYTLYDKDGIVIAAVVVGENDGVKDLVYVHSDGLDLESYNSTEDEWTWTRKVIFNGEEITLTEKGDSLSDLEDMDQFQWYEIKRNSNGEIISATEAWDALNPYRVDALDGLTPTKTHTDAKGIYHDDGYFLNRYDDINQRVETANKDTVLYQTDGGPTPYSDDPACHTNRGLDDDLVVIGNNTLAVQTETGSGIHFRDNVNVVWQYYNQNTKRVEIETGTGVEAVKDMVDFVNKNNDTDRMNGGVKQYYYLSALIEKNFATTIVVWDSYNNYEKGEVELTGTHLKGNATIESVNKALLEGNVIIDETWRPADLVKDNSVNTNVVKIPSNRTLMIDGDFIAYENRGANSGSIYIESGNGSKLIVNGDFDMADQTLSCDTEVNHSTRYSAEGGNMTINLRPELGRYVELYAKLDVAKDLTVKVDPAITNPVVRVNTNAYVDVDGQLTADTAGVVFTIYGHLEIGNDSYNGTTTFPIHYDVYSDSTLKAGTLYGTFCVGSTNATTSSGSTGRVEVTNLRTTAAAGGHSGATLNKGTLEITGKNYTTGFNIGYGAPKIVFGDKASDEGNVFWQDKATNTPANVAGETYTFTRTASQVVVSNKADTVVEKIDSTDGVVSDVTDKDAKPDEPSTKYAVTIGTVTGGTVTADVKEAAEGATVTLTATPTTAGQVATYTVTGADNTVVYTGTANTFKMPGQAVTVTATFAEPGKTYAVTITDTDKKATVTPAGLDLTKVPAGTEITITVADAEYEIKDGSAVKASPYTFTVNEAKTITVSKKDSGGTGEGETVITKIEQTGTAGDYTFTITYTGPTPDFTTEAGRKLVLDALKEKYPEITMTSMVGAVVYNGDTKVGTVVLSGLFKVYGADGKALKKTDGTEYTFTGAESQGTKETLPVTGSGYLVNKDDPTEGYEIKTAVNSYIEFEPNGADADVYLVAGYQLSSANVDNTITKVEYNNETVTTNAATYFPKTAVLTLTGTVKTGANSSNYTEVWLTVGGSKVGSNKTVGDNANTYTLDLSTLTDSQLENNAIKTIAEAGAAVTTIKIGSFENKFEGALTAPVEITILPSMVAEADKVVSGNYVIKTDNMADYADSNATVIAVTNDGSKITIGEKNDSLTATENVLELVPMTQVTFKFEAENATAKFSVGFDTENLSTGAGEDWYFKTGVQFKPEYTVNGKTAKISAIVVDDQGEKVKDVTISNNGLIAVNAMAKGEDHIVVTFLEEIEEITLTGVALGNDHTALGDIVKSSTGIVLSGNGSANWTDASKTLTFKVKAKDGYCFASEVTIDDVAAGANTHGYSKASASAPDADGVVTITCTVSEPTG